MENIVLDLHIIEKKIKNFTKLIVDAIILIRLKIILL